MIYRFVLHHYLAWSLLIASIHSFHPSPQQPQVLLERKFLLYASGKTPQAPLYDGTNYTFPDTTTPEGIAEVLEVSFVHACMQLQKGYVDVLKMFIAAAIASYAAGFSVDEMEKALSSCPNQTANRPLMLEEVALRHTWYSLVYLTLESISYPTRLRDAASKAVLRDSIPDTIRSEYGDLVQMVATASQKGETISIKELLLLDKPAQVALSELESAVRAQSLRVVTLTFVVIEQALEASQGQAPHPPTPPIEGAFE